MTKERNDLKAGLFILVSIALIIGVIVGIKGIERFLEPVQERRVRFRLSDDIAGLSEGDPVRIGGAKVGSVRSIELETDVAEPGIVITFSIPERFKLSTDAVVTIQSTVTGVAVLNFESLGVSGTALPENQMLAGKPGGSIAQTLAMAQGLFGDVRGTTLPKVNSAVDTYRKTGEGAGEFIAHVRSKVDPIVERYNAVADKGTFALNEVGSLFSDTKSDFRSTIANLNSATGSVRERVPGILEKADGTLGKIGNALDKITESLADIREVAVNAKDATASARSILTTNRSKIDAMIAALKVTGDNLKAASSEVRRSPWRLLYKPGPGEMANLNLFDSARQFAEGASSMEDAASALRDALKDPKSNPEQIQKLVDQLDSSFHQFTKVESELWQQVKE